MLFSQSIFAQLMRMTLLLAVTLVAVHNSPRLLELLAEQAMNSGCHQSGGGHGSNHHHHLQKQSNL